jgi:pimeloyl-ACP methyl ester carboxylesterase
MQLAAGFFRRRLETMGIARDSQSPVANASLPIYVVLLGCGLLLAPICLRPAQTPAKAGIEAGPLPPGLDRIDAQPEKGFLYPYYLYTPPELREDRNRHATHVLLVLPNNTGKTDDDFAVHDCSARRLAEEPSYANLAAQLKVAMLVPVFPRPASDWRIYTHALNRDSLLTENKELRRFDLQLIAMIDDARGHLQADGLIFGKTVLMFGFSASGMFTNRFTFIHPDRIRAAAFGSPGGWAMAPLASWEGKPLRYPIGTADFEAVTGKKLDMERLRKTPMFLFMGTADTNDSVIYRDSYDQGDQDLIFSLFGKTLMARWPVTESMYHANLSAATLKLYPGICHKVTEEMLADVRAFFLQHLR